MSAQYKIGEGSTYRPDGPAGERFGSFYVTAIKGRQFKLLLGPFDTHEQALALVDEARLYCSRTYSDSFHEIGYGTSQVASTEEGCLNGIFGP